MQQGDNGGIKILGRLKIRRYNIKPNYNKGKSGRNKQGGSNHNNSNKKNNNCNNNNNSDENNGVKKGSSKGKQGERGRGVRL